MTIVNVKLRNTYITLAANDEKRVLVLADRFNERMEQLSANANHNATDQKLALMAALIVEDELDKLRKDLESKEETLSALTGKNTSTICKTLDQISVHLEQLAEKLEKS